MTRRISDFLPDRARVAALLAGLACMVAPSAHPAPSVPYAHEHVVETGDSPAVVAEKAAKVLPRANQVEWMRLERTFFLHFGVNTFNEVEWGTGREDPAIFNPAALDARQWLSAVKQLDGKMLVLVAKHHDGFSMWPTRYTAHSSAASPWRGGKGDLVREVSQAAREAGVKFAVYLSPADLYQLKTNPKNPAGYYGNGSPKLASTIPTDPASFKTDPGKGRAPTPGFKSYRYEVDDYNRYFLNQLYELLTEYGPIAEVWFDGANPDPSVSQTYDYNAWYDLIRHLQPGAVIMGKGPDVRWVGSESGYGRTTEWSVVPLPKTPERFDWPDWQGGDIGSRAQLKPGSHLWWYPAETNVTILGNGQWFWARSKRPRPVPQLVDIFYSSIGRNGNLILNLSPDNRGLVPDDQVQTLAQVAEIVRDTFRTNLAAGARLSADHAAPGHGAGAAADGRLGTWWEAAAGRTDGSLTLSLPQPQTFDVVSLQEAVDKRGQRIERFALEAWDGQRWVALPRIRSDETTTVGQRRLIRLSQLVTTDKVRVRIEQARFAPTLAEVALYRQSLDLMPPSIADRDAEGRVAISHPAGGRFVYTTDGSAPTAQSPVYAAPLALPSSGIIKTARLQPDGRLGVIGVRNFVGLSPRGWKVVDVDSEETAGGNNAAALAIDGDSSTYWHTRWGADLKLPHHITVDMGQVHRIAGFVYLPRQDGVLNGTVENYRLETSEDGQAWSVAVDKGTFANVRNNPDLQEVRFAPVKARFFRFTALDEVWRNGWTSAAELSVIPAQ
ncbi:discoidin domain-containing protein [Roseateles sp.]|uniref:discoidin domain-containing protein n=1 Tax=Roseateles sp. TaxID=1971397 RepID=UPI002E093770|nr:alpha-L-fucosidase [Roseateles sp.]HEV6964686.1 alpha-L-fucosidase [Roseateles sp.]